MSLFQYMLLSYIFIDLRIKISKKHHKMHIFNKIPDSYTYLILKNPGAVLKLDSRD